MKHPTREQLVAFFYEDCDRAEKSELAQHLDTCAECRAQLQTWRATASALNQYELAPATRRLKLRSWLPLSAAAAILLAAGAMFGASWQTRADSGQTKLIGELRNRVEKSELENIKTKKLLVDLTQSIAENRARDQAALIAVAQELQATRKDFETVTVLTAAGLKSAQNEIVRLASYNPQTDR
jgi:hypothetical protein